MANFRTHVTFSSLLGCGYAAAGYASGVPLETSILAGGLCGLSGMLPDLDSDSGIPLRESMAFAAAIVPALLFDRLRDLDLKHDQMVLLAAGVYFFVRFGITKMIAGRTTHRGMFHSIPAALIFAGGAFLLCTGPDVAMRCFKAGGVFVGVMSHLVLDEVYSFEVKRGKVRIKRSFGTAVKFWGKDGYSNVSTYTKLVIIAGMIFCEPAAMDWLDGRAPTLAAALKGLEQRYFSGRDGLTPIEAFGENVQHRFSTEPLPGSRFPRGSVAAPASELPHATAGGPAPGGFQPGVNYFEAAADRPPGASR